MSAKALSAISALLNIVTGAGIIMSDRIGGTGRKVEPTKAEPAPHKVKPRRAGEPSGSEVEVEEIKSGEYLPKPAPVSTEAGFSKDAWSKVQLAKQRRVNGWN